MAIPLDKLTENDYKILEFISSKQQVSKEDICNKFTKNNSIEFRLKELCDCQQSFNGSSPTIRLIIPNYICEITEEKSFLWPAYPDGQVVMPVGTGIYRLTDEGVKALEDYLTTMRVITRKSRVEWIRYIVTTLIAILALLLWF
jgi:hypothetical protein